MKTLAKLKELDFNLLLHPPYTPDVAPSNYWLLAGRKKMLQGKRFGSNEEVIAATKAYFEEDKSFYKRSIEKLEIVGMIVSYLKVIMLMNKNEFCEANGKLVERCVKYVLNFFKMPVDTKSKTFIVSHSLTISTVC